MVSSFAYSLNELILNTFEVPACELLKYACCTFSKTSVCIPASALMVSSVLVLAIRRWLPRVARKNVDLLTSKATLVLEK